MRDDPKTSDEYIEYIACWLSGDSGWSEENVRWIILEFKEALLKEHGWVAESDLMRRS